MASAMALLTKALTLSPRSVAWAFTLASVPFGIRISVLSYTFASYFATALCCAFDVATVFTSTGGPEKSRHLFHYGCSITQKSTVINRHNTQKYIVIFVGNANRHIANDMLYYHCQEGKPRTTARLSWIPDTVQNPESTKH